MSPSLRIKWCILRTSIEERLVYRADFAFATLVRFLPIITQVFLWSAIYQATGPRDVKTINGYTYGDMVAYSLLVMVGRAFSSMPGLTTGIARDVRDGSIKKFLVQPIDLLDYLFWHRVAHKLVYYFVALLPFGLVFWLCRDYFRGWPEIWVLAGAAIALVLAFLIRRPIRASTSLGRNRLDARAVEPFLRGWETSQAGYLRIRVYILPLRMKTRLVQCIQTIEQRFG